MGSDSQPCWKSLPALRINRHLAKQSELLNKRYRRLSDLSEGKEEG